MNNKIQLLLYDSLHTIRAFIKNSYSPSYLRIPRNLLCVCIRIHIHLKRSCTANTSETMLGNNFK